MNKEFHAIYENGVLRLVQPLDLPNQTPVHGFVEGLEDDMSTSEVPQSESEVEKPRSADGLGANRVPFPQNQVLDNYVRDKLDEAQTAIQRGEVSDWNVDEIRANVRKRLANKENCKDDS